MAWHENKTEKMAGILRFLASGALLVNAILIALSSVYVTGKFCWFALRWLDRLIFAHPW